MPCFGHAVAGLADYGAGMRIQIYIIAILCGLLFWTGVVQAGRNVYRHVGHGDAFDR